MSGMFLGHSVELVALHRLAKYHQAKCSGS